MRYLLIAIVSIFLIAGQLQGAVIYVNAAASGANNGTNWEDAFNNLQSALSIAVNGDQIWVASGTYMPDGGYISSGIFSPGNKSRNWSFPLKEGVSLYGGFSGIENNINERDWQKNITVLSGDLNNNDGPNFTNNEENSNTVVSGKSDAVIDGFTISGGNYSSQNSAGGLSNYNSNTIINNCTFSGNYSQNGGAIFNYNSSPTINNCFFNGNKASIGGGIYNENAINPIITNCKFTKNFASAGAGVYNRSSNPTIFNCTFNNNNSGQGAGIYNLNTSNPIVANCSFIDNVAGGNGGGIYSISSFPFVFECVFKGNMATRNGGGISIDYQNTIITNCTFIGNMATNGGGVSRNVSSDPALVYFTEIITNSVFIGNSASNYGGACYTDSQGKEGEGGFHTINCTFTQNNAFLGGGIFCSEGLMEIKNSILWQNTAYFYNEIYGNKVSVINSDVSGYIGGGGNLNANPLFEMAPSPGTDNTWGTEDDDLGNLCLQATSPCIDAGNNLVVPVGVTTDRTGIPRFIDGNQDETVIVDIGAHEYQAPTLSEPFCGDINHPYPSMDFNQDCHVNLMDFVIFSTQWLDCTAPDCE